MSEDLYDYSDTRHSDFGQRKPSGPVAPEPKTNRQAHEEAAGMGLCDEFFTFSGINPDAVYVPSEAAAPTGGPYLQALVIDLARETYDRFMMGGWQPQDAWGLHAG